MAATHSPASTGCSKVLATGRPRSSARADPATCPRLRRRGA